MTRILNAPTCEIITIGSELLLGQIMDTNSTYLSRELAGIGMSIRFRTAVGDCMDEIVLALDQAVKRSDMVLTTGGLGPTLDDLTREAVARLAGVGLEFRHELMSQIEAIFRRAGYRMPDNNRRQAYVPEGSRAITNPVGTAPGFIKEVQAKPVICLPGVPRELEYLIKTEIIPWIRRQYRLEEQLLTYRVLKTAGIGESKVDAIIGDLMGEGKNPEVGLLASMGEIKIRIAAAAANPLEAEALILPVEKEIRSRLGNRIFGSGDDTLEGVIEAMLRELGLTVSILETFTGGMITNRFCGMPSARLRSSLVIPLKPDILEWSGMSDTLAETERGVFYMAEKMKISSGSDVGLAIVGFPERKDGGYGLKGLTAAAGDGIEKSFTWEMGGDLYSLQQRGSVVGLNTLRLALSE